MSLSTNTTYRFYAEKLGGTDPSQFVGDEGEVFLNPSVPTLKLSDGSTPGGIDIGGSGGGIGTDGSVNTTGIITASSFSGTTATFSGNISVGGTLTYEDVTNVDSIGLITARTGIEVLSGIVTTPKLHVDSVGSGITFSEDLVVQGDARVTGILSIGTSSIVLDSNAKIIRGVEQIRIDSPEQNANPIIIKQSTEKIVFVKTEKVGGVEVETDQEVSVGIGSTVNINTTGIITASSFVGDGSGLTIGVDDLSDVDTSTVAPTDGQALLWDNANSQWEPGTISSGTTLPSAQDGEALIYENGQWVAGPVIGGVNYSGNQVSTYTAPSGFKYWNDTFTNGGVTSIILSNNDLTAQATGTTVSPAYSTSAKSTGRWYWEISLTGVNTDTMLGITVGTNSFPGASGTGGLGLYYNGTWFNDSGATVVNTSSLSENDVVMFALDAGAKKLWVGLNGTWENSGDPAAGTGAVAYSWTAAPDWLFAVRTYQSGMIYTIENNGLSTVILASDSIRTLLGIGEYADDTAAGTGGLSSGELYYNTTSSSYVLKI